ncbi:Serpentine Receptor, class T [Caenorhabditis elegans]|uniref:Serpentine Receptor, class T n=1 Tax=Caenorhabditis elegans TaxID=6239 RepID=O16491_CAEEL|nr:Serpentine Receptor, class T [Caenorhabditis elegans]CCD61487.1 Serpentine Receptor, class T [Caenorhabditis elegans]|eukprot:NP_504406.1 Serpentine Receptor, class T [Caenorhabditis elegans]
MSLFQLNNDVAMVKYGVAYFCIALPLFPVFFVLMKTICIKDRENSNLTYKLMNLINFCQVGQTISHFISGPMLIFPNLLMKLDVIIRMMGCIMNSLWIADFPVMTLLAVCRILIFSNIINSKKFPNSIKCALFLIITWTMFLIFVGCATLNMQLVTPGWDYDFSVSSAEILANLEVLLSFACLASSYVAYLFMAYLIYAKKNLVSCVHSRKNEIAILVQSTFVTTYITAMIFVWHQSLFSKISFIDMESKRNQAILNCCLIIHCYVNPIMTLVCNKSIRDECLRFLKIKKRPSRPSRSDILSKLSSIHPINPSANNEHNIESQ